MTEKLTRSQQTNADITALLRARNTLLWVITREEVRVEAAIVEGAAAAKYETVFWDCGAGLTDTAGKELKANLQDPVSALDEIKKGSKRAVYVMRDMHRWSGDPNVQRKLRNLARSLQSAKPAATIVVLTPSPEVPVELSGHAIVIDYPLPERAEISAILDLVLGALPPEVAAGAIAPGTRDAVVDAAVGLTAEEATNVYAKSVVTTRLISVSEVATEKKRVVAREKVLTWHDPDPRGLEAVGGLDALKKWLTQRRVAFGARAREYGLPAPRGCLLTGIPGTGKSLTAKAVAAAWNMPLLRLDLGALRSKYVGESEANVRKALSVAETVSPCVLWIDELEKALAGSTGPQGDGGVAADALGTVLSWMQERQGQVFVIATSNDVTGLPPELLRKGRFDELFFVDLPTRSERAEIMRAALAQHGRTAEGIDLGAVAEATLEFTGSEIAAIVPDALFEGFADGERAITTEDLVRAASAVVPLSQTAAERIGELRAWAKGRARPASTPEKAEQAGVGRNLDL